MSERRNLKGAEDALRKSKESFPFLMQNASDVIGVLEADGTLRFVSPAVENLLGYMPGDLIGTRVFDYVHPEDFEGASGALIETMETPGILPPMGFRILCADGSWRHVEVALNNLLNDPNVGGVVIDVRDITERVRVEEKLRALQRDYEELLGSVEAIIWRGEARTLEFTFVSDQAEAILGYPAKRWTEEPSFWADHIHPEDREWALSFCKAATAEKRSHSFEYRMIAADGSVVWLRDIVHVSVENGVPTQLFGVMVDITEHKEAEKAIELLGRRNELLLNSAGEGIYGLDPKGRTTFVNPAAAALSGFEPEELIGKPQHEVIHHSHSDGTPYPKEECPIHAVLRDGEIRHVDDEVFWRKDGTSFPVDYTSTPLWEDGEVIGAVVTFTDITDRKEAEKALKESEERYRSLSEELALLHHVRTALAQELDLPTVLCKVVDAIAETYGYTQVSAYLLEGEELVLQHEVGYRRVIERFPVTQGVSGRAVRTGQPILLEDVRTDPYFLGAIEGITSEICVPLFDEGEAVGFINVESTGGVKLTQNDLELLVALGEHVSVAISRARLHTRVRESEERFRSLTQNSSDIVTLLGDDGSIRYQSPSVEHILGYSPEEMVGKNAFDYVHPEDLGRVEMAFAEGLKEPGRHPRVEYRFRHKDGSWSWLESVGTNLLADPGVGEYVVNSRDVTKRRRAEERLREAEERYRTVVEEQTELVCRFLPDLTLTFVNDAYCRYFGEKREELIGTSFMGHIPVEDQVHYEEQLFRLSRENPTRTVEHRVFAPDGEIRWQQWTDRATFDGEGRFLECQSVGRDVTERKWAEEALKESEERYRAVMAQSVEAIYLFDAETKRILESNAAFRRLMGYAEDELLDMRIYDFIAHDKENIDRNVRRSLEKKRRHIGERRYRRKDGSVIVVDTSASIISYGGRTALCAVSRDVTERKEAEERLRMSEERLAEAQRLAHLGGWEWNIKTEEITWSDEVYRIYGLDPQSAVPSFGRFMEIVHPDDRGLVKKTIDDALYGNGPYDVEHRVVRPDGEVRMVHRRAEVLRGEGGEPLKMIGTVHDITERKILEERLEHQAFYDPLTGLPNRYLFADRLRQALRRTVRRAGSTVAMLFMDLDGFKAINDSLGHEMGDQLLVAVAERLESCLRSEDTLARFGGDEFVVLLEGIEAPNRAVQVAKRITEEFRAPFAIDGRELYVKASIGISLRDGRTKAPEDLLRGADTAMYRAKDEGIDYKMFDEAMHARAVNRLELENDLRRAIEREEFVVHYQPIVNLQTGGLWGLEALVRWDHPERGLLDPDEFVPVAEESGLVVPMGELVLGEACRRAVEWQKEFPRTPPLAMFVNLSGRQLRRPNLHEVVRQALEESGLSASSLGLDITETAYIGALEANTAALDRLKALGIRISLDDFGTGYSSVSYLKRLPAEILKIDKTFTRGLGVEVEDTAIMQSIVDLAHILGMEVVAEGLEVEEQETLLKEMGCDMAQGFHFAKPLPPDEVVGFLSR